MLAPLADEAAGAWVAAARAAGPTLSGIPVDAVRAVVCGALCRRAALMLMLHVPLHVPRAPSPCRAVMVPLRRLLRHACASLLPETGWIGGAGGCT